ncbi:hypothetical protein ABIE91_000876 [Bradyrhizobium elkanii]
MSFFSIAFFFLLFISVSVWVAFRLGYSRGYEQGQYSIGCLYANRPKPSDLEAHSTVAAKSAELA